MPRLSLAIAVIALLALSDAALAQNPPPPPTGGRGEPPPTTQPGGRRGGGGGGGGRGGTAVMTLSTTAWADGAMIPAKHAQGPSMDVSPALTWTGAPQGTASFVLLFHDADGSANTIDGQLLWMLWNIPGTATGIPQGFPHGDKQPDGTRQISQTGPNYRGPAAPAVGPVRHYMFELFALDTVLNFDPRITPPTGGIVTEARTAVLAAMAGHVRGKAILFGLYRRPE